MPIFLLTNFAVTKKVHTFASLLRATPSLHKQHDSLAQLVEHNTFNVGVLGSSPRRITKKVLITNENL